MDPLAELKQTFFQECEELLGALEQKLQALDEGSREPEDVNAAFRAIHSIKGGAGAFGCTELVAFAHVFEASLDHLRSGRVAIEDAPFGLFLRCSDAVADLVSAARNDEPARPRPDLLEALERVGQAEPVAAAPAAAASAPPVPSASAPASDDAPPGIAALGNLLAMVEAKSAAPVKPIDDGWDDEPVAAVAPAEPVKAGSEMCLRITPDRDLFRRVIEPRVVLAALPPEDIVSVSCDLSHVPSLEELDVTDCWMRFAVNLRTQMSVEELHGKFDFTLATEEFEIEAMPEPANDDVASFAPAVAVDAEVPQSVAADLSAISIEDVNDRVGQQVRTNLIFGFTGGGKAAPPRYDLAMRVISREARLGFERDETAPAYSVTVTVTYELKEISTGKVILRSLNRGVASYDRSNQAFANQRARIDAEDRAAQSVADDIQLRLAAALATRKPG